MSGIAEVIKGAFKFSVTGDAVTISAMGVTKVRFPKAATPGDMVVINLTNFSYTVDFNTYPVNAGCGLTTTVNWANAMPWFIYLGNTDDSPAGVFAFNTRDPRMVVTPAVGLINDTTAVGVTAQSQDHINSFKADDATIAAKPCICIGSHTMTWDTADDRWTLGALTTADGFGKFQGGVQFTFPVAQNGAGAGVHGIANGGTVPTVTTDLSYYLIRKDGSVCSSVWWTGDAGADGAGAVTAEWALPYAAVATIYPVAAGVTSCYFQAGGANFEGTIIVASGASYLTITVASAVSQWSGFSNGARSVGGAFSYQAF